MTSATLYREGDDLDVLLADLDAEYPGQVRVVEVSYPRTGGIGGFFAKQRVGVQFALTGAERSRPKPGPGSAASRPRPMPAARQAPAPTWVETREPQFVETRGLPEDGPLGELVASADSRDNVRRGEAGASNADFAKLLLELAAKKSAGRAGAPGADAPTRDLDAQLQAASKLSRPGIRPAAAAVTATPAQAAVVAEVAAFTKTVAAAQPVRLPAAASPLIDSVIADAVADAIGPGAQVGNGQSPAASFAFEPIAAPVIDASIEELLTASDDVLAPAAAIETVEPHTVAMRRRKTTTTSPRTAARRTTGRRSTAQSEVYEATATAAPTELTTKISVPDLALRSLTSATAAIVEGDTLSASQKDVMKDLRDKLADVVVLLDKLADAGETS
jgi:hypothetical protein